MEPGLTNRTTDGRGSSASCVLQAIGRRHSVRGYTGELPDDDVIRSLLDAAVQAPTALGAEPCSFVVIQDRAMLRRCSERAKRAWLADPPPGVDAAAAWQARLSDTAYDVFHGAGTLVLVCARDGGPLVHADGWLAAENLMLAAVASDLGSCCIGLATTLFNQADVKRELWINEELQVVVPIVVGRPLALAAPAALRSADILRWVA